MVHEKDDDGSWPAVASPARRHTACPDDSRSFHAACIRRGLINATAPRPIDGGITSNDICAGVPDAIHLSSQLRNPSPVSPSSLAALSSCSLHAMLTAEHVILRHLLAREPNWVSGSTLAAKLGVSRVTVWQHMEKLRAAGFTFEARRSRGYRLAARPATLHTPLIETLLPVHPRGFSLLVLDEIDSTNDEAVRQLAAGRTVPFAVLARRQTRGRGRFGRVWHSESSSNLYASFGFRPRVEPGRMQTFTLWMGVNICELLTNFTGLTLGIKWPNDLVFEGRKAGGMLTEARVDADQIRDLVFGIGINVNTPAANWPAELARRAVALAELAAKPLDLNRLAAALIGRVMLAYQTFADRRHLDTFADLWNRFDVLRGRTVTLLEGGRRHHGVVSGLDDEGALILRDTHARLHRFRAGEVTLDKTG
jgi:BirA family biotin operon repressor/biotin-[acetyl-CoA-carboxylase] ligase